jgi:hypothetical protein
LPHKKQVDKTTTSSTLKETRLRPWHEVWGTYQGHTEDEEGVLIEVRAVFYVRVPLLNEKHQKRLEAKKKGEDIGVLRTDMADPAYSVR